MEDCERLLIKWKDVSGKAAQTEVYEALQLDVEMESEGLLGTTIFKHSLSRHFGGWLSDISFSHQMGILNTSSTSGCV